jgi:hypothetical protein
LQPWVDTSAGSNMWNCRDADLSTIDAAQTAGVQSYPCRIGRDPHPPSAPVSAPRLLAHVAFFHSRVCMASAVKCSSPSSAAIPCTLELIHRAPSGLHHAWPERLGWVGEPLLERDYEVGVWSSSPASRASHLICNGLLVRILWPSLFALPSRPQPDRLRCEIRYGRIETTGTHRRGLENRPCSTSPCRKGLALILSGAFQRSWYPNQRCVLETLEEWSVGKPARSADSESGWMARSSRPQNSMSRMEGP